MSESSYFTRHKIHDTDIILQYESMFLEDFIRRAKLVLNLDTRSCARLFQVGLTRFKRWEKGFSLPSRKKSNILFKIVLDSMNEKTVGGIY